MRTLCPNFDREDGLETVLEVPMPEELFCSDNNNKSGAWQSVKSSLLRSPPDNSSSLATLFGGRDAQIQMLLGIVGAPSIPLPVSSDHDLLHYPISKLIKNQSIQAAMAKYIVKQYTAAAGGEAALSGVESMYAMGKVKMGVTDFCAAKTLNGKRKQKMVRIRNVNNGNGGEMGGFVLWKKGSSQWSLELVVSGCKVSAGCDGNVAWKQSPWLAHSHASNNEPSGPLRRFLQGLDPKTTANMFAGSVCIGEKVVNDEECFVLKLETQPSGLKSSSKSGMETVKHTVWGCFSQRTGLLVQLEDTCLVRIKTGPEEEDMVLWETTAETMIEDYKTVDGIQIAHRGRTRVSLLRLDESLESHSKTTMEESWEIEEVGFNVKGLSSDFFLPPGDLRTKEDEQSGFNFGDYSSPMLLPLKVSTASWKLKSSKVTAIEDFGEFEG
ncbi:uncharacterized protein LOC18021629 [Eutrema salsugineum]|uniref:uncharacterized protein LOC18021629 n=1 Tax=Eutrema salsugineum TaxID=72664 RepID=UPI000CED789F|nr:uncharacterized protein LOC18021629 [Eutrema salsugineum]